MATLDLRNTVKSYVASADERLLKMMKALAESYQSEEEPTLSEEDYAILDRRRESYLKGEGKSYNKEEIKQNARRAAR